jgi:hypothetical protein
MKTMPMKFERDWLVVDETYPDQIKLKQDLLNMTLATVYEKGNGRNSTEIAKREAFDLVLEYLPSRYPEVFEKQKKGKDNTITN